MTTVSTQPTAPPQRAGANQWKERALRRLFRRATRAPNTSVWQLARWQPAVGLAMDMLVQDVRLPDAVRKQAEDVVRTLLKVDAHACSHLSDRALWLLLVAHRLGMIWQDVDVTMRATHWPTAPAAWVLGWHLVAPGYWRKARRVLAAIPQNDNHIVSGQAARTAREQRAVVQMPATEDGTDVPEGSFASSRAPHRATDAALNTGERQAHALEDAIHRLTWTAWLTLLEAPLPALTPQAAPPTVRTGTHQSKRSVGRDHAEAVASVSEACQTMPYPLSAGACERLVFCQKTFALFAGRMPTNHITLAWKTLVASGRAVMRTSNAFLLTGCNSDPISDAAAAAWFTYFSVPMPRQALTWVLGNTPARTLDTYLTDPLLTVWAKQGDLTQQGLAALLTGAEVQPSLFQSPRPPHDGTLAYTVLWG